VSLDFGPRSRCTAAGNRGVWTLTKHIARTLGPVGIRINAIAPGWIETDMTVVNQAFPEAARAVVGSIRLGRMAKAVEVDNVALFVRLFVADEPTRHVPGTTAPDTLFGIARSTPRTGRFDAQRSRRARIRPLLAALSTGSWHLCPAQSWARDGWQDAVERIPDIGSQREGRCISLPPRHIAKNRGVP
jgi:Enoyl-(Acyl carrier protein) reductase